MNDFSCCPSCTGVSSEKIFTLGSYVPYTPGYSQTYSMPEFKPMGVAGPLMGKPVARPYPSAEPLPIGSTNAMYRRGDGNPAPFISLPTFNGYASTGNPAIFNPLSGYASTGNPAIFNPLSAYPSPSNPIGALNPVGESMPAQVGHPYRVGGDAIGGMVQPLGSWCNDEPWNVL